MPPKIPDIKYYAGLSYEKLRLNVESKQNSSRHIDYERNVIESRASESRGKPEAYSSSSEKKIELDGTEQENEDLVECQDQSMFTPEKIANISQTMSEEWSQPNFEFDFAFDSAPIQEDNDMAWKTGSSESLLVQPCCSKGLTQEDSKTIPESSTTEATIAKMINNNFSEEVSRISEKYFKISTFRKNQLEAMNATLMNFDTLILMPTGAGKSLCYQLPSLISRGVTIVISPLKSLIEDQIKKLEKLKIKAATLSSNVKAKEIKMILDNLKCVKPTIKLLYTTPEKLTGHKNLNLTLESLYKRNMIARFVIDEAHCITMWGKSDFRKSYRKLSIIRKKFPAVPIMALTATAPPEVRIDIQELLNMDKETEVFLQSFDRPNLKFEVKKKIKRDCCSEIASWIVSKCNEQSGIVYCLTREECESVAEELRTEGIRACPYHAGLKDDEKKRIFEHWETNEIQVVCATIAFGMGIDKSDVRFVIHYSMPKSIDGYYQEAGRAGRDGKFANCILYYSGADLYRNQAVVTISKIKKKGYNKAEDKELKDLEKMSEYCRNTITCRRKMILEYLGEEYDDQLCLKNGDSACDNCSKDSYRI